MRAVRKTVQVEIDAAAGAYLGVTASARGMAWRDRLDAAAAKTAIAISQRHALPELLGRVLASRGIGLDEVPVALDPTVKALMPDPSTVRDMEKGAARLAQAIVGNEAIAVFGDYDVDGACSAALLQRFLAAHGREARIYIPDRMTEGYGPNREAIEALVKGGARLIVTVDCGTTGVEPLAAAGPLGADVVVVDHHQAGERLPDVAAVINPNRQDDLSGLGNLCAAGVVFMLLVATARELRRRGFYGPASPPADLLALLDLVGLATVCDVVPLEGLNRAYVTKGLQAMRQRRNTGLRPVSPCRPRPIIWASCWGRASTPGGASATPRSARVCWRPTTRWRQPALRCCSTSSTASARPSRRACWRRPSPMPSGWWTRMPICRCC
jgi:single-stranded-DNA-specific exonuclease